MICFRDTTYCASLGCINECGQKMSDEVRIEARKSGLPISFADICMSRVSDEELQANIKRMGIYASPE